MLIKYIYFLSYRKRIVLIYDLKEGHLNV